MLIGCACEGRLPTNITALLWCRSLKLWVMAPQPQVCATRVAGVLWQIRAPRAWAGSKGRIQGQATVRWSAGWAFS